MNITLLPMALVLTLQSTENTNTPPHFKSWHLQELTLALRALMGKSNPNNITKELHNMSKSFKKSQKGFIPADAFANVSVQGSDGKAYHLKKGIALHRSNKLDRSIIEAIEGDKELTFTVTIHIVDDADDNAIIELA